LDEAKFLTDGNLGVERLAVRADPAVTDDHGVAFLH
jgi:hypothetical protein